MIHKRIKVTSAIWKHLIHHQVLETTSFCCFFLFYQLLVLISVITHDHIILLMFVFHVTAEVSCRVGSKMFVFFISDLDYDLLYFVLCDTHFILQ